MSVVAIGNFDGLHLGHQALLKKTIEIARQIAEPSVVYTFIPHPRKAPRLMSDAQKKTGILKLGIEQVVFQEFTTEFASMTPEAFIQNVLVEQLGATHVVVGPDFAFGAKAGGDILTLKASGKVHVDIVAPVWAEGILVSSSAIRQAIGEGDLARARRLMGRPYALTGVVTKGAGRGKILGFPTANLSVFQEVLPPLGVYATHVEGIGRGATNIGRRPTFDVDGQVTVETYFLDFDGDLYGQELELVFDAKIRAEKKFSSPKELAEQISRDVEVVLTFRTC